MIVWVIWIFVIAEDDHVLGQIKVESNCASVPPASNLQERFTILETIIWKEDFSQLTVYWPGELFCLAPFRRMCYFRCYILGAIKNKF